MMQEDWVECRLEEISTRITKGATPTTYGYKFQKSGINFLKVENVKNGVVDLYSIRDFISLEANENQKKSQLETNDILFSIAGTIGNIALVKESILPANTNQAFAILRGINQFAYPMFIVFQLSHFVEKLKIKSRGGAMLNVSLQDLKDFIALIPPLPIQRAIVKKIEGLFSALDAGIADLQKAQSQLTLYRQAVLKKAFEGEFEMVRIGDKFNFVGGGTPSKKNESFWNGNIHWASIKDIKGDFLNSTTDFITSEGLNNSSSNLALEDEVILATRINPGRTIISKIETAINQDLKVIKPLKPTDYKYIHYLFKSIEYRCLKASSGTTVLGISLPNLKDLEIPFTEDLEQQQQIVKAIESRLSVCEQVETQIKDSLQKAEALRQSILKKAFEGKLLSEVEIAACKKEPDYEPAAVLLEKIKAEKTKKTTKKK
ncbi:restriction endonuclease subunit S [Moheibacter lacus]|uniref:Restriction endonuclease subunit S n=1 Tax=Moheibacter lacus TaxID=2745851 RepID=A0A838ZT49_9FLAO|nr:restriction endonuclease subunit S [Moheibacter lacus]MBA5630156.1 restriction endonuclease subunit S [Moheibacter lacus]